MQAGQPLLVSACLLGIACRYDGTSNLNQPLIDYLAKQKMLPVPVCPEQLGGLPTPRPKAWHTQGDGDEGLKTHLHLIDENGTDVGPAFLHGAHEVLKIAKICGCKMAVLKQRSPSCGNRQIYRNGELTTGVGVTCAVLQQAGIKVVGEESLDQL
jgi:uncharacterized protein YbbK (DUF523 family)